MKKTSVFLLGLFAALSTFAQGTVQFQNRDTANGVNAAIYDLVVGGTKLEGTGFLAQLYYASGNNASAGSLVAVAAPAVDFRTGAAAGFVNVGANASRVLTGVGFSSPATIQIRAWSAAGGSTYEAALAAAALNPAIHIGVSPTLNVTTASSALVTPPALIGLQSFAINPSVVPEPSTYALAGVAAGALLFIRRRRA